MRTICVAVETGLHDFRIGVSSEYDPSANVDETTFATCASYVGNVRNEKPLMVDCSTVLRGRYVSVYIPESNNIDMDRMLLCDVQIFGLQGTCVTRPHIQCSCNPRQLVDKTTLDFQNVTMLKIDIYRFYCVNLNMQTLQTDRCYSVAVLMP